MKFRHSSERDTGKVFLELPVAIRHISSQRPAELAFRDNEVVTAGCLSCKEPRCKSFRTEDSKLKRLSNFASSPDVDVCPTGALEFQSGSMLPSIDEDQCISCGLCLIRCPVGAIFHDNDTTMVSPPDGFVEAKVREVALESINADEFNETLTDLLVVGSRPFQVEDEHAVNVVNAVGKLPEASQNAFVRSVLTTIGASFGLSRKGDVHTRLDGIYELSDGVVGPVEIESGWDSLEAARAILDDMSVLHNRYGIPLESQSPLVVFFELPKARQGYWQVVEDIRKTQGIEVRTVSLGALLLLLWEGKTLDRTILSNLKPVFGSTSIRNVIENAISRNVDLGPGQGGVLEPSK